HMGFAWCRREAINRLPTFREAFIPDVTPDKLEAGTYVYENVAGMDAAGAYLEGLRRGGGGAAASRARAVPAAVSPTRAYESGLSSALLDEVSDIDGLTVHGVTARDRLGDRVPTLCFSVAGHAASAIAEGVSARGVGIRSGHMYSPRLMARIGAPGDGVVRASLVHYNTAAEIAAFGAALREVIAGIR